jgi:hypothetical protein
MTTAPERASHDIPPGSNPTAMAFASFAGVMLLIMGAIQVLQGIAAIAADEVFVTGIKYAYKLDVTAWGWIHTVIGAIAVAAAFGIFADKIWAYVVGIAIACLAALANFAFLPYYPLWSIVVIAFSVVAIWAMCTQISTKGDY